jgi:predicted MFS family arabinose efflux permease
MGNIFKNFNNPFVTFKNRNFRLYWIAWSISLIGTWMQNIAQPWLAYSLTGSAFLLSLVGALQFTPILLFSLFAGVIVDRFPKKTIILITQACSVVVTMIPAVLIWTDQIRYWHLLVLATLLGFINAVDMPARQTFVTELVGKKDTMNAIALNSAIFNTARIVGPALAGLIMGYTNIAFCFFLNSLSFLATIAGLIFVMPEYKPEIKIQSRNVFANIKDGLQYTFSNKTLFKTVVTVAIVATFAMNFSVLIPVFTINILKSKEAGFGFLMSCMGIGSLCGALGVATTSKSGPRHFNLNMTPWLIASMLIITGFTNSFFAAAGCLFLTGFFFVSFSSSSNSNIQINSSDQYRGRAMSVYTLVFSGSTPIGNLYAGFFSDHFGPRAGFYACGIAIVLLNALVYILRNNGRGEGSVMKIAG